ncbi:MAG: phosphate ABC transporter substrate-binding protein [Thermodesulfobacteriota bacterium]
MKRIISVLAVLSILFISVSASAEKLVIKGSTTVLPIAQKAAEAFMKDYPDIDVTLSGGGSGNGIKALIDQTADIGNASRFIKFNEVQSCVKNNVYPVPHRVALDAIVPVVNNKNTVKNLSLSDLEKIYLGKAKNWKEFGGPDMEIVVVSRDSSSGTYGVWSKIVLGKKRVTPRASTVPSNGAIVQAVASTKGAIGYIGLGYMNDDIKPVDVNGVKGTEATTKTGEFPISRALFMFTNGWPEGKTAKFINYVLSEKGQSLVKEAGSIPAY